MDVAHGTLACVWPWGTPSAVFLPRLDAMGNLPTMLISHYSLTDCHGTSTMHRGPKLSGTFGQTWHGAKDCESVASLSQLNGSIDIWKIGLDIMVSPAEARFLPP